MVVAAGTGGHVMPGLAVAEALRARGWSVSWLGTRVGMERQLVEPRGIAFDAIDFAGLRGKGVKTLLLGGFYLLRALWQSRALIRARKPRVMFSTGGYVAVPAGMAASTLGVPLVLLNSDAAPLMSTKMLKSLASAVLCGFDGAAARAAGDKGLVTGNPVRAEIAQIAPPEQRYAGRSGPLQLLVIGGSLGAQVLNENVPRALALVSSDLRARVVHQCGAKHIESVRALYREVGVDAEVVAFIDDMPDSLREGRPRRLSRRRDHRVGACCGRSGERAGSAGCVDHFAPARKRRIHGSERRGDSSAAVGAQCAEARRFVALAYARSAASDGAGSTLDRKAGRDARRWPQLLRRLRRDASVL